MIDLRQGDCLELMKDIADGSIDMIFCDLPYQETGKRKSYQWNKSSNEIFSTKDRRQTI